MLAKERNRVCIQEKTIRQRRLHSTKQEDEKKCCRYLQTSSSRRVSALFSLVLLTVDSTMSLSAVSKVHKSNAATRIKEAVWREAAKEHQNEILKILEPGLTRIEDAINSGIHRQPSQRRLQSSRWTALDPKHPVYNFLIEYYGLKGARGVKRLARWSPSPEPHTSGIFLEGASSDDLASLLHLRGAIVDETGILYSPQHFFEGAKSNAVNPYLWFRLILEQTLNAEPVLYCHGLHEWAMQYQPEGAPEPPSAQYQSHLKLRVDRSTISTVVERKGIKCTHVDALRYFSPAAAPLNQHGVSLNRMDQLRLEQPACVHAHMDLLKITLKLQPFVDPALLRRVLQTAIDARTLDVAASPYDAAMYGLEAVPIETAEGRADYRIQQSLLMSQAEPVRRDLLDAYNAFLDSAFSPETIAHAVLHPDDERFAKAEPGGLPWRRNIVTKSS